MDTLSNEILIHIFAQGTAKEISLWRRVSKTWNDLINDDFVWKTAFLNFWNGILPTSRLNCESWKEEYVTRMDEINKMSNHKPEAIRIATKKHEILDIFISGSNSNFSIKVLDLKGLTSAIVRPDGRLDQKFILFFDNVFGVAPVTFCGFFDKSNGSSSCKLILGMADGNLVIFKKCPSKTLLEDYEMISATVSTSPIVAVFPHNRGELLTVHKKEYENCYEFVDKSRNFHLIVPDLKSFLPIRNANDDSDDQDDEIIGISFITKSGNVFVRKIQRQQQEEEVSSNTHEVAPIAHINFDSVVDSKVSLLQTKNSKWLIVTCLNRILIINILTGKLTSTFILPQVKTIQSIQEISNSSATEFLEVFVTVISTKNNQKLLHLQIEPETSNLKQEVVELEEKTDEILSIYLNQIYFIVVTIDGIYVHDTLSHRLINKRSYPKYFLKYHNSDNEVGDSCDFKVKIEHLTGNQFLFIWGRSLAHIWDFNPPKTSPFSKRSQKSAPNPNIDKGLLGNKSTRKYSKYALNSGVQDWEEEVKEEEHLDILRNSINIEGLTEEELIQYAKMISANGTCEADTEISEDVEGDPELQMALKLSLMEM